MEHPQHITDAEMEKYIDQLFDRPIAFHRCLVTVTGGSVQAGLMLSQALYWSRRTKDAEGWFYKTREEWWEETGLSRAEQQTARKRLRECSFWGEDLRGIPAILFYRINKPALWRALLTMEKPRWPGSGQQDDTDGERPFLRNQSGQFVAVQVARSWPPVIKERARVPDPDPEITPEITVQRERGARASRQLPNTWAVSTPLREWAQERFPVVNLALEAEKFYDYYRATGKVMKDWDAAFRNWVRRAPGMTPTHINGKPLQLSPEEARIRRHELGRARAKARGEPYGDEEQTP